MDAEFDSIIHARRRGQVQAGPRAESELPIGTRRAAVDGLDAETLAAIERLANGFAKSVETIVDTGQEGVQQRRLAAVAFIGKVFRNDFEGDLGRHASNVVNISLRTMLVVTLGTCLRDVVAFEIGRANGLETAQSVLEAVGIGVVALAAVLNVLGGLADGVMGSSTKASVVSRVVLSSAHTMLSTLCHFFGSFPALRDNAITFGLYSFARDLMNFVFSLKDNLTSLPMLAVLICASIHAAMQVLGSLATGVAAPLGGTAGLPTAFLGNGTDVNPFATASVVWPDTIQKAQINGFIEVCDDLAILYIARFLEVRYYRAATSGIQAREQRCAAYEANLIDFAENVFNAPAKDRMKMMRKKNEELCTVEEKTLRETHGGGQSSLQRKLSALLADLGPARANYLHNVPFGLTQEDDVGPTLPFIAEGRLVQEHEAPDFSKLERRIRSHLAKRRLGQEQREEAVKQLFMDNVLRYLMPLPASQLHQTVRDEILQAEPDIGPIALRQRTTTEVVKRRSKAVARLRVSMNPIWKRPADGLGPGLLRQVFTTNAARHNTYQSLLAFLILTAFWIDQFEDSVAKTALSGFLVAAAIWVLYPALYKVHDTRPPTRRLELPGGTGAREVRPEELGQDPEAGTLSGDDSASEPQAASRAGRRQLTDSVENVTASGGSTASDLLSSVREGVEARGDEATASGGSATGESLSSVLRRLTGLTTVPPTRKAIGVPPSGQTLAPFPTDQGSRSADVSDPTRREASSSSSSDFDFGSGDGSDSGSSSDSSEVPLQPRGNQKARQLAAQTGQGTNPGDLP